MRPHPSASHPSRFARVVALFSAAMVMVLSFASVSPDFHRWLHERYEAKAHACAHHDHAQHAPAAEHSADALHECAVTLFSHGILHDAAVAALQPCEGILRGVNYRAFERLVLARPRYLHRPPQAPPAV